MENRNMYMVHGCRSPLTLDQLAQKLGLDFVPGFYGVRSSELHLGLVQNLRCYPSQFGPPCGNKDALYARMNERETHPSATCFNGPKCHDSCMCCGVTPPVGSS